MSIMKKRKLLVIIDNLKKGGAEVLLVGILPELNRKYDVALVTLSAGCDFPKEQVLCSERYELGFKGKLSFMAAVIQLRRIVKKYKPDFIHAHLFYSSLAARLVCPASTPLLYSVHNELSKNIFNHNAWYKWLEKGTIRDNHSLIAVSQHVFDDYSAVIGKTKKHFLLRNYIEDDYFEARQDLVEKQEDKVFKLIAVGNLKASKNYEYLLNAMLQLKEHPVSLDVYGNTNYSGFAKFLDLVQTNDLKVSFKGKVNNVKDLFASYDAYIMSSTYEGFGIAAVEAMAMGLPVLLSDIPVLREVSFNNALFFDLKDPDSLAQLLLKVMAGAHDLQALAQQGTNVANQYTKHQYLQTLFAIYEQVVPQPQATTTYKNLEPQ